MVRLTIKAFIVASLAALAFATTPVRCGPDHCADSQEACTQCCNDVQQSCEEHGGTYTGGCQWSDNGELGKTCDKGGCFGI